MVDKKYRVIFNIDTDGDFRYEKVDVPEVFFTGTLEDAVAIVNSMVSLAINTIESDRESTKESALQLLSDMRKDLMLSVECRCVLDEDGEYYFNDSNSSYSITVQIMSEDFNTMIYSYNHIFPTIGK